LGGRPTVPLKTATPPSVPSATGLPTPAPIPVTQKAAAPKKETARITLPPGGTGKPILPKATVKMGQTQPLVNRPGASSPGSTIMPVPATRPAPAPMAAAMAPADDGAFTLLSVFALVVSAGALGVALWVLQVAGTISNANP
jgi:hypothetical protein